jgi:hypothetical protein
MKKPLLLEKLRTRPEKPPARLLAEAMGELRAARVKIGQVKARIEELEQTHVERIEGELWRLQGHAKCIAEAVMNHVEGQRTITRADLEEAVLAELVCITTRRWG